jgi:hypothetical protein
MESEGYYMYICSMCFLTPFTIKQIDEMERDEFWETHEIYIKNLRARDMERKLSKNGL